MDEDDSQDELINRSSSHSKGKRAALWAISDDSDDLDEESEEEDSDSGDDEEEHTANGEDDEEEDSEEEDDNEEEEDAKSGKGTFGGGSADFAEMSSDEDREKCPICLNSFSSQPVATPENCEHYFCFDCILEWTKNANSCPVDRIVFDNIYLRKSYGGKVKKIVTVQKPVKAGQEETVDLDLEQTNCEVCGGSDHEDRLLLCDGCDAGYHMECLTPPLDSVPVEEWFCPECEANNRQSRGSAEEISDTDSLFSTPRPATSRSRTHTAGPTRAIARTQQSERVRANVNRHRITQARTSQLAPTYLIQSTWLDETINAVVAGLNTAVYVRDITPRAPSSRRRKTGKRRKVRRKKTSSKGNNCQAEKTRVKRRKRRARKSKSRKKAIERKVATPRSRIANNLGIVKDKKSSSLPTVYRPSENTLSSMRADIGAASLSIYGDPFDLDPFVDHEEVEEQAQVTSLLEAKRRGISRSALRSHQPVARPVTAGLSSRRSVNVPHLAGVVEAAPVPDLLGSILSGQSILLMDSSDVVISRDGSLKASKPMMQPTPVPSSRNTSSSSDTSALNSPGCSYNLGDNSASLLHNGNPSGSSATSVNGLLTPSSSHLPSFMPSSANHYQSRPHSDLTSGVNPSLPPHPNRSVAANGMRALTEMPSSSAQPIQVSNFRDKGTTLSLSQPKKAPVKPTWVDVSVLPRIPKIKRENSSVTNDSTGHGGISDSSRGSSNSAGAGDGSGLPKSGMNSLSGDKGRQQSVDKQKGHSDGHKNRPERAGSSSAFSNSFASSSSTTPASQTRHASFSSSSAVSFRINSSGNSWHARRLSITSSTSAGSNVKEQWREKEEEAKKKQMHKDKKTLLASCTVTKEQDNIYDPFNPTLSDSSSSSDETEPTSLNFSSQFGTNRGKRSTLGNNKGSVPRRWDAIQVKTESEETEFSQEIPRSSQLTVTPEIIFPEHCIKVEKKSDLAEVKQEKQKLFIDTVIKKEPSSDEYESSDDRVVSESEIKGESADTTSLSYQHVKHIKAEENTPLRSGPSAGTSSRSLLNYRNDSSPSCSGSIVKKQMQETKSDDSPTCSSTLMGDLGHRKQTSKSSKDPSSSETDRGRREDLHALDKEGKKKEREKCREKDRSSRRSRSRERKRAHSTSDSSQPNSPDRVYRKKRRSRSRSKDKTKRRSRSCSSSSSREHSKMKKNKGKERNECTERSRVSKDRRHGRSRSKSRSKSRSRSRSRSKDRKRCLSRSRSRSRSRERRKDCAKQHATVSSRDKVDSRAKDGRQRINTGSRDRRKEEGSTSSTDKTSASHVSSSKRINLPQERKKEKEITQRSREKNKCAGVKKQELPSCSFVSQVKDEDKNFERRDIQAKEIPVELKNRKEIKKEKPQPVDMFEDCPIGKEIKSEEKDKPSLSVSQSDDEIMEDQNKTELYETTIIKSEASPTQDCPSPPVSSPPTLSTEDPLHDSVCQFQLSSLESDKQQNTAGAANPTKLEPSESDDDFNVDVMLDNLDHIKSEPAEGSGASAEEEKEAVEEKEEGEPTSAAAGSKSKTQVKRVTWNIQEPEGPQPEKSPSKLALYKLKLKQEGSRKPPLAVQASTQSTVCESSKKSVAGLLTANSSSEGLNPEELSTTEQREAEEGDLSRKDKYLKKLHMQERAVEEVKLAIKPFYQRRDINKDEYKEILRKAVLKVCHSKSGEINPVKVGNLIKAYVEKYKHTRRHKKGDDSAKVPEDQSEPLKLSDSP
ncbi:PHD and RING finger domain-containing protein 1 [Xiphophorus maculatus]|uniref:PHD and ring finger domains 1 n=1 Tax=Xiphophorus maculatus TaxID=8083 RepID=A0A3B5QJE3_XIPMA|nr:PHD and RING finger domain-containing protein 1 [Xiphophorus maculatus]XP_023205535.1 PHD and RING finger domain-containing protein 1 [Xiphophorus maculatus]XP_023205538.1 PHD and RING finger domain-containing protein 1 [Xiphophorus maculatus]